MAILVMRKSDSKKRLERLRVRRTDPDDDKLKHFRKLTFDHLDAMNDSPEMKKAGMPVGTVRDRKGGKKYIKIAPGKWRPKYDNESRSAKLTIAAIRRKVAAAKDAHEIMQIVLENRDRFSDAQGKPLPFVMELSKYVAERGEEIERQDAEKETKRQAEKKAKKDESDVDSLGLRKIQQQIEQQRKERNSVLSRQAKQCAEGVSKINDARQLEGWLESAKESLRSAKSASLKTIKRQYDYSGGVSIGQNELKSIDIPDMVSPADIKDILIYNAQAIVSDIQKRMDELTDMGDDMFSEKDDTGGGKGGGGDDGGDKPKRPASLKDNIHKILNGTDEEKKP
jgi:hypothetical protein